MVKNVAGSVGPAIFQQEDKKFSMGGLSRQTHGPVSQGYFKQEDVN